MITFSLNYWEVISQEKTGVVGGITYGYDRSSLVGAKIYRKVNIYPAFLTKSAIAISNGEIRLSPLQIAFAPDATSSSGEAVAIASPEGVSTDAIAEAPAQAITDDLEEINRISQGMSGRKEFALACLPINYMSIYSTRK